MLGRRNGTSGRAAGRGPMTLESLIASVRRRWRARVLFRGGLAVGVALLAALAVTALGLEVTRFSAAAVVTFRWLAWGLVALTLLWFVVRPLLRRVTDEQVVLYLEEHEPSLKASVLGALQARNAADVSPELAEALVRRAVDGARRVEFGRRVDGPALMQAGGAFTLLTVVTLGLLLFGPLGLRRGAGALLPGRDAASVNPYAILVTPGDLTIARGSDQFIEAELVGFSSPEVSLFTLRDDAEPTRLAMLPRSALTESQDPGWEVLLVGLDTSIRYFVESDGIRSPTHSITVVDLPYVDRMDHTYVYPGYTGLPARTVEGAGDVAALAGTRVDLTVQSTLPAPSGRLVVDDDEPVELTRDPDGSFSGSFVVGRRGFYRIELALDDGTFVEASPEYTIDVLTDQPPTVDMTLPGRDTPASPIEELYLEAESVDDYGVGELLLVYSVNGTPEDTVRLYGHNSATPLTDVTAGHTLYLEDFEVVPGDLISYYAVARDLRSGRGEEVVSDIYFVNVQPFRRDFREAEQQGGPPQGGQQGAQEEALSDLQRQVIAATFNLVRDAERYSESELAESLTAVALAQERVREQVSTLAERMTNRGLTNAEDDFREIAEMLPEAVENMTEAAEALRARDARGALAPEQQALSTLQKAEETYERYVGQQAQQSGGQGGQGANADDLADLFELELDQLQNQYETVQRGERQDANEEVDEVLERLRELSQRQQQEAERQRARAAQQGNPSAGGGSSAESQRELADETEEAARQLQQLARQTGDRELAETARELQEAADAMRRAAANAGSSGPAEARSALDRLEDARRRLQEDRDTRLEEDAQQALDDVRQMRNRQAEVQRELEDLPPGSEERREAIRELVEEKGEMAQDMLRLRQDLTRLSQEAQQQDPEAARALRDAADLIEEEKIAEKIQYSRGVIEMRDPAFARIGEEEIEANLEALEGAMERAAAAAERVAEQEGLAETLDRARDLQDRMASLDRRLNSRSQADQEGQTGGESGQGGQEADGRQAGDPATGQAGGGQGGQRQGPPQAGQQAGNPAGSGAVGGGEPLSPEEIRQFQRELQERLGEAIELRDELRDQGQETGDLDGAIRAMESLRQGSTLADFPQVELLQEAIRESLGRVEFSLRRQVRGDAQPSALGGSEAVPESFRRMVEEYYRTLARERGGS